MAADGVKIVNLPLKRVVVEIEFDAQLRLFSVLPTIQQILEATWPEIMFSVSHEHSTGYSFVFQDEKSLSELTISPTKFHLAFSEYLGWAHFVERLRSVWLAVAEHLGISEVNQVRLGFFNVFENQGQGWVKPIPEILGVSGDPPVLAHRSVTVLNTSLGILSREWRLNWAGDTLELDLYNLAQDVAEKKVLSCVEALHRGIEEEFFQYLLPAQVSSLKGGVR